MNDPVTTMNYIKLPTSIHRAMWPWGHGAMKTMVPGLPSSWGATIYVEEYLHPDRSFWDGSHGSPETSFWDGIPYPPYLGPDCKIPMILIW